MNKYEVIDIVGEGAYGVVLKCKNKESQEFVAIKKFKESEDDEAVRRTTIRELKVLRQLKHTNIVNLIEAFRRRGKLYLVFEYVSCNMLELLDNHPHGVASKTVMSLTYQLLKALHWCHSHQVIHRDIKPENLLISEKHELKLCDFGFARALNPDKGGARYTEYVATRWYRAPELLVGNPYGMAVDVWSAGCIMGELADGRATFPGESDIDQLYTIQKKLGPLPELLRRAFFVNPRFMGVKFPNDMPKTSSLAHSFKKCKNMTKAGIELMQQMLQMSPSDRPTSVACLAHRAFSGFRVVEAVAKMPDASSSAGIGAAAPGAAAAAAAAASAATATAGGGGGEIATPPKSAQSGGGGQSYSSAASMTEAATFAIRTAPAGMATPGKGKGRKSAKRRQDRSPHTDDSDGGGGRGGSGTGSRGFNNRQQPVLTQTLPVARGSIHNDDNPRGAALGLGKEGRRPRLVIPSQPSLRNASVGGHSSSSSSSKAEGSNSVSGWRTRSKRRLQSSTGSRSDSQGGAAPDAPQSRSMKSMELPQKPIRGSYGAGAAAASTSSFSSHHDNSWRSSARHAQVSIGPTHGSHHPPRSMSSAYSKTSTNSPKAKAKVKMRDNKSLSRKPSYGSWEAPTRNHAGVKGLPQLRGKPGDSFSGSGKQGGGSWSGVTTL